MPELNFDTGLVTYNLNGKCEVTFNPSDSGFVEQFYDAFESLEALQKEYSEKAETMEPGKEIFHLARERDAEMSKIIDGVFSAPVCEAVFSDMSVCAFANGFPVWLNLMLAVMDEIEANVDDAQKKAEPRVAKYTAKYQKYTQKYKK